MQYFIRAMKAEKIITRAKYNKKQTIPNKNERVTKNIYYLKMVVSMELTYYGNVDFFTASFLS